MTRGSIQIIYLIISIFVFSLYLVGCSSGRFELRKQVTNATTTGDTKSMKKLLARARSDGYPDESVIGKALSKALEEDQSEIVELIIADGFLPNDLVMNKLASAGANKYIQQLLNQNVSPKPSTLNAAIKHDHLSTVQMLANTGVQANSDVWLTALESKSSQYLPIVAKLPTHEKLNDACVIAAVTRGNITVIKQILDRGGPPTAQSIIRDPDITIHKDGFTIDPKHSPGPTALGIAANKGYYKIAKLLIQRGADVNKRFLAQGNKLKPLPFVPEGFKDWHIQIPLGYRPKPEQILERFRMSSTPLISAIMTEHVDIVSLLLRNGAEPSRNDDQGKLPVQYAQKIGNTKIMSLLKSAN